MTEEDVQRRATKRRSRGRRRSRSNANARARRSTPLDAASTTTPLDASRRPSFARAFDRVVVDASSSTASRHWHRPTDHLTDRPTETDRPRPTETDRDRPTETDRPTDGRHRRRHVASTSRRRRSTDDRTRARERPCDRDGGKNQRLRCVTRRSLDARDAEDDARDA